MQRLWQKPQVLTLSVMTLAALFSLAQVAWHPDLGVKSASTPPLLSPPRDQATAAPLPPALATALSPTAAATAARAATPLAPPSEPVVLRQVFELDRGDTLAALLGDTNIVGGEVKAAMNAIGRVFDMKRLRQGQDVTLTTRQGGNTTPQLLELAFRPEATTEITVSRLGNGAFKAEARPIPTATRRFAVSAMIDSSLFGAGAAAGVPSGVMKDFSKLLSYQVDFQRDIHPGDRFHILYDQTMTRDNVAVGAGQIVFAALESRGQIREIYQYKLKDGSVDYFTPRGESIRRGLLRTPVDGARITSGFGMRMHPILGYSKMHKGVDFGAPTGSPIFAAGDGVIEEEGWKGSYGRYIRIRHNATLGTAYAHMNGFAANVHQGGHVRQGQVIGYIGMTGRATGPHLHYEVLINGTQVNPMSVNVPTSTVLTGHDLDAFRKQENAVLDDYQRLLKQANAASPTGPETSKLASAAGH